MKIKIFLLCSVVFFLLIKTGYTQNVTLIPDPNFEKVLIDMDIDTDGEINGQVLTADIETVKTLNIIDKYIDSLDGIENFRDLETLNCALNNIKNIDVSSNTNLISLDVSSNQLSAISIASNTNLTSFNCSSNQLNSLDVSKNTSLTDLNCSKNNLIVLDVSKNTQLTKLNCSSNRLDVLNVTMLDDLVTLDFGLNKIKVIDVSHNLYLKNLVCADNQLAVLNINANDSLTFIDCSTNQLSALNVSNNKYLANLTCSSNNLSTLSFTQNDSLVFLACANNKLVSINVASNDKLGNLVCSSNWLPTINVNSNTVLTVLDVSSNLMEGLDVSNNDKLTSLNCYENQLKTLNINNGANGILTTFKTTNNPNLYCITVDDEAEANNNTDWKKDDIAKYKNVCTAITYIPDDNFEAALSAYDDILNDNFVPTANILAITKLALDSLSISDMTGLDDFINVDTLDCSHNDIYNLNVEMLTKLVYLDCSFNKLVDLSIDNANQNIDTLNVTINPNLSCIQVSDSTAAEAETKWIKDATAAFFPECISNKTYVPDDNFEQALIDLGYDDGSLDDYVVTDSINTLKSLDVSALNISTLTGISDFILLDTLECSSNRLSTLNLTGLDSLKWLACYDNYLTSLNVENDTLLEVLLCNDNYLNTLDLSKNLELLRLECNGNQLASLDLSVNTKLTILNCNANYITSAGFDLSNNDSLVNLNCSNNKLSTLDLTKDTLLVSLDFSNNAISQIDLSKNDSLRILDCSYNNLSSLSLTENKLLTDVKSKSNLITGLNLEFNTFLRFLTADNNQLASLNVSLNDSLREIYVSNNKLPSINIANNTFLEKLDCADNLLDSLTLGANDSLKILTCSNNNIPDLILSNSLLLRELTCNNNLLDSLILSSNDSLVKLSCTKNNLDELDVSNNLKLEELNTNENIIEALDVSKNTALIKLSCSNNKVEMLDVSSNTKLESLLCSTNDLTTLVVKNGNNANLATFQAVTNPYLKCIEVDDENQIGDSWKKDDNVIYANICHYTETYIPDDNFESAVALAVGEPDDNDDYIQTASIESLTTLNISSKSISDLTGIEEFVALTTFDCSNNPLDTLVLNENVNLTTLNCSNTQLDTLVLTENTALENLNFSTNQVTVVDVAHLTALKTLTCNDNQLINIDLILNVDLIALNIANNKLEQLHVKNGTNTILTLFDATNNPLLGCIEVDDPDAANAATGVYSTWLIDPDASFSGDCHYGETYVPDDAFEQVLKDLGYDGLASEPLDDYVLTSNLSSITSLYIRNEGIADLTGIEVFTALKILNCSDNLISILDFSDNLALETLRCYSNQLTDIDVSANILLSYIDVSDNLLASIDLSANTALTDLNCSSNKLETIDILSNTALKYVDCSSNKLSHADANNGTNSLIIYFDLRGNPDLTCILVDDIDASNGYANWFKDQQAAYKLICNDDDNDGIPNDDDLCPGTPFGEEVDLFGCSVFTLPTNNFSILTTSESCRSANNGMVNISANEIYSYTATITGNGISVPYNFTNTVEIRNLRAAIYELCIVVAGKPNYLSCYEIVITEPEDLDVHSKVSPDGNSVSFNLSGGTEYTIDFNGLSFTTRDTLIALDLEKGNNTFEIRADVDCQGVYKESIFVSDEIVAYPNPFNDYVNIYTNDGSSDEVYVEIYSFSGQLILKRYFTPQNGLIRIETASLKPGVYLVSLKSRTSQSSIKIIKK